MRSNVNTSLLLSLFNRWNSCSALLPGKLNVHESTKLARKCYSLFAANKRKHRRSVFSLTKITEIHRVQAG